MVNKRCNYLFILILFLIVLSVKTTSYAKEEKLLDVRMDADTQKEIYELCDEYNIDFALVMAIIMKESSFRTSIISKSDCYGLMQINVVNHDWLSEELGITDFLDPIQNVEAGLYMLRRLFEKYEDVPLVLMAYNLGEACAKRKWKQEIYSTKYVEYILDLQEEYYEELGCLYDKRRYSKDIIDTQSCVSNSYKNMTKEEANGVINVWTIQLKNMPCDIVFMAVNKLIATNEFQPSISEVKKKLGSMYYEAVAEMLTNGCIDEKRLESLKRIKYCCYNIDKEPTMMSLIGCSSSKEVIDETYDKYQSNMSILHTRG